MPLNIRNLGITTEEIRSLIPHLAAFVKGLNISPGDMKAALPLLIDIVKEAGFGPDDLVEYMPWIVDVLDMIIALVPNPLVRFAWRFIRAFLLSREGAQAVFAAVAAKSR